MHTSIFLGVLPLTKKPKDCRFEIVVEVNANIFAMENLCDKCKFKERLGLKSPCCYQGLLVLNLSLGFVSVLKYDKKNPRFTLTYPVRLEGFRFKAENPPST